MSSEEDQVKEQFQQLFPLCNERDLPWAICQIGRFLKDRIATEIEQGTLGFTSRVIKVLCEISPPKQHVEDMARIVVNQVYELRTQVDQLKNRVAQLEKERKEATPEQ